MLTNAMFVKRSKKYKKVSNTSLTWKRRRRKKAKITDEKKQLASTPSLRRLREREMLFGARKKNKNKIEFEFNTQAIRSRN